MLRNREKEVVFANIFVQSKFDELYFYLELHSFDNSTCHSTATICFEPEALIARYENGELEMEARDLAKEYLNSTISPNAIRMLNDKMAILSKQYSVKKPH